MDAKKKEVENLTASDLGVEISVLQSVTAVEPAPEREAGVKIEDDGTAHLKIVELLEQKKVI
jgi:electron transfer flavoprotein alpha/beta subunit